MSEICCPKCGEKNYKRHEAYKCWECELAWLVGEESLVKSQRNTIIVQREQLSTAAKRIEELENGLRKLLKAADPFMRLGKIVYPSTADYEPIRDYAPGLWPTVGDARYIAKTSDSINKLLEGAKPEGKGE